MRFLVDRHADNPHLPSFPTRRSSDLSPASIRSDQMAITPASPWGSWRGPYTLARASWVCSMAFSRSNRSRYSRSEEHTSELQSQSNLVCRLLLEKKKKARRRGGIGVR